MPEENKYIQEIDRKYEPWTSVSNETDFIQI